MLPEPSNQKRKRGRPPNASQQSADAPQDRSAAAEVYDDENADDERRLRKRGSPRKSAQKTAGEGATPENLKPPRRKGRPSLGDKTKATQASVQDGEAALRTKRKRVRPSLNRKEEHEDVEPKPGLGDTLGKQGAANKHQQQHQEEEDQDQDTEPSRRKRRRPPLHGGQEVVEANSEHAEAQPAKPRRRRRPSLHHMPSSEARNKAPKPEKGGGSSKAGATTTADDAQATKDKKRRSRPSGGGNASSERINGIEPHPASVQAVESIANPAGPSQALSTKQRRFSQNADAEDDNVPLSPAKPYAHIAPHIQSVRQSTIEAKWSPLAEPSLFAASAILHLAHRPILQRLSNTQQRRTHTSAALRLVTHRITRRVAKGFPFPPASMAAARAPRTGRARTAAAAAGGDDDRAAELDFESVLDAKQALERHLDPALHAVELLVREKERQERELERDYEALRNLESSARAQAREHRSLLKKAHILAPATEAVTSQRKGVEERDILRHEGSALATGGLLDDLEDGEFKSLALQVGDHVESIRNNLRHTEGIIPQLARGRAVLRDVLFRYLDQEQYEHVVLELVR